VGESRTHVLCEMAMAVDARTLGSQVAHLSFDDLAAVDDALKMVLGLGR
jgi:mRNA-degrading endonuclease toxin of MazEF toxin-antitoxin module